jgi:hypothetical protein
VWYFTLRQIRRGREKDFFHRSSYVQVQDPSSHVGRLTTHSLLAGDAAGTGTGTGTDAPHPAGSASTNTVINTYSVGMLQEVFEPGRWSSEIDAMLVEYVHGLATKASAAVSRTAATGTSVSEPGSAPAGEPESSSGGDDHKAGPFSESGAIGPWDISPDEIMHSDNFRALQKLLSRHIMENAELSHRWGIAGPKRKAVVARIGLIRLLNHHLRTNLSGVVQEIDAEEVCPLVPTTIHPT